MKLCKNLILVALLLTLLVPVQPVHADAAPPPAPLLTGLEPFQYQKTQVQMVYERVELEVQGYQIPDYPPANSQVWVRASFVMRNQGKATESMQSIFPLQSLTECGYGLADSYSYVGYYTYSETFEIKVNGITVPTQEVITPHPYKNKLPEACAEMHWIGFDVTFPPNTDVVITVSYLMGFTGVDGVHNIDYVLETGGGWYGPIERAYIVAKFPYAVSQENVLKGTTPGYQSLYNEIFWSFQNLEPTSKDNIRVSIVAPDTWESILSLRQKIKEDPSQPEAWLELIQAYTTIAYFKISSFRDDHYRNLLPSAYEQALAANPDSAELCARYALFQLDIKSPYMSVKLTEREAEPIVALISRALSLDPANEMANSALSTLQYINPDLTLTPPPTLPPTETPAASGTPTLTPLPSVTPKFGGPEYMEVTVVQTQIVTATPADSTATLIPTATSTPTPQVAPKDNGITGTNWVLWPIFLVIGLAGGIVVAKKRWI